MVLCGAHLLSFKGLCLSGKELFLCNASVYAENAGLTAVIILKSNKTNNASNDDDSESQI